PAAWCGMEKVVEALTKGGVAPESIRIVRWGGPEDDHNPGLPHGYDLRDALRSGPDPPGKVLETLLADAADPPAPWLTKGKAGGKDDFLTPLPCSSWKELENDWRKAMRWTGGLR